MRIAQKNNLFVYILVNLLFPTVLILIDEIAKLRFFIVIIEKVREYTGFIQTTELVGMIIARI